MGPGPAMTVWWVKRGMMCWTVVAGADVLRGGDGADHFAVVERGLTRWQARRGLT